MKPSIINMRKIIKDKYQYDIFLCGAEECVEDDNIWDENGNNNWSQVWRFHSESGDRFFKFWGEQDYMYESCVEVVQKKEMREVIYYTEV